MTESTADTAITNLNARVDMLSSQLLQITQMTGVTAERSQQNQRELINYVTQKIEELTNVVTDLQAGLHTHGELDSNGQVDESSVADAVRTAGRGRREGGG